MSAVDAAASAHAERVAVIANMQKMTEADASALKRALSANGVPDVDWVELAQGSDVKRSVTEVVERGARTVVVCGGDGTVRLAAEALVGTGVALSVVPQGTGNVFVSALGLPTAIDAIARAVASGERRTIDTGTCNGSTFNLTAGSGFDVGMMAPSDQEKKHLGVFAYIGAAFREMLHRRPFDVQVQVDGSLFYDGPSTGVLVGNLGTQIGSVKAFPDASPTDGLLHVAVVTAVGPWNWLRLVIAALMRQPGKSSQAELRQGAEVTVTFGRRRRFELDGDILGRAASLKCRVRPMSLIVCASLSGNAPKSGTAA